MEESKELQGFYKIFRAVVITGILLEMGIKQMVYVQIVAEQLLTVSAFVAVAIVLLSVKHVVQHLVMGVAKLDII